MNKLKLSSCLIIILLINVSTFCVEQDSYKVKLNRAYKVGQKFNYVKSSTRTTISKATIQGKVKKDKKVILSAKLEGTLTVLEIDEQKRKSKIEFLVNTLSKKEKNKETFKEFLPKGTKIIACLIDNKMNFKIKDKEATKDEYEILKLFFSFPKSKATADIIYGTKRPQAVGNSWKMNNVEFVKKNYSKKFLIDPKDISGTTKFEKIFTVDNKKCLMYVTKIKATNISFSPEMNLTVTKALINATYEKVFPANLLSNKIYTSNRKMDMSIEAKRSAKGNTPEIIINIKATQSAVTQQKLIK